MRRERGKKKKKTSETMDLQLIIYILNNKLFSIISYDIMFIATLNVIKLWKKKIILAD